MNAHTQLIEEDIEQYLEMHQHKSLLRFITCGSVDDGKSTLIGRLLYEAKALLEDQLSALESDSKKHGTQGGELDFALLVDGGVVVYDSTLIFEYLEDRYPQPRLYPADPAGRARCRQMEAAADEIWFPWLWKLIEAGFNYALPLWYEDHLTGLLLLDASPRIYLDEEEPILRGLTRQISHSIENLRIVEEKIALEKTVLEQEHLAKLGRAAAAIAHEVKNPLSSIKTLVQLMREDAAVESNYSRDLKYIVGEIDRLNASVMQLLSFSRPAADLSTDVDISGLLDATLSTLGRQSRENGVEIERHIDPAVILQRSNPELLQQVVLNLVLNAVQASPEGGRVLVAARAGGNGSAVVSIEDQGSGIPAQHRERIFEPFFTTKQKGTGLGLAIVQKNVRQLRGKIEIESPVSDGRGTRITLTLPLER